MVELENSNILDYEKSLRFKYLAKDANKYFGAIQPKLKNSALLAKTLEVPGLSKYIAERAEYAEKRYYGTIFDDKDLADRMRTEMEKGNTVLPEDPVDRERWLALIYIAACQKEQFSYGNVLHPLDYLPIPSEDEEWDKFIKLAEKWDMGDYFLEDINMRRAKLREENH